MYIKYRFYTQGYEPKKLSANSKTESEELDSETYGATFSKGYFLLPLYFKVRKRQYGKKWTTQFVTLCRDEVLKLEEYKKSLQPENKKNSVGVFLSEIEIEQEQVVV